MRGLVQSSAACLVKNGNSKLKFVWGSVDQTLPLICFLSYKDFAVPYVIPHQRRPAVLPNTVVGLAEVKLLSSAATAVARQQALRLALELLSGSSPCHAV
jgi:hypothetical protein